MNKTLAHTLHELMTQQRVAALGTLWNGLPYVTQVPFALSSAAGGLLIHVSRLAAHTQNLLRAPDVSLLVSEPDGPEKMPHALPRVTLAGVAAALDPDDPDYASARQTYQQRFPEATGLFELGDFHLFTIEVTAARIVAGFAQAATLSGEEWAAVVLSPHRDPEA